MKQNFRLAFECVSQATDVLQTDVPAATFNPTNIGSVKIGPVAKLLLRYPDL